MARRLMCGVDESGRGPWAGPVVAAAVILPAAGAPDGAGDSKALSPAARARLEPLIRAAAIVGVGLATVEEIDRFNIRNATFLAMRRAVEALAEPPDLIRVDGRDTPDLGAPVEALIGGDALDPAIGCASIIAKEVRDRLMIEACAVFPGYGFSRHKGYGVPAHAAALALRGPCAIHRMSFAPVRAAAESGARPAD
jgi:ribonuclease HII